MLLAAITDVSYQVVLVVHLVAVVVAFAPPIAATIGGGTVPVTTWRVSLYGLVVAGLLGIVMVLLSSDAWEFSQAWISLAFVVWIAMAGVVSSVVVPALRDGVEKRAALGSQILSALFVLQVYLMVFKPGAS